MMKWLIENWFLIVVAIVVVVFVANLVYRWMKQDKATKISNIKEWLKFAVVESEKALGSKTGSLKLRYVYDMAANKFPWIVTFISFDIFSEWVDEALEWMKKQLESNAAIVSYVDGDKK